MAVTAAHGSATAGLEYESLCFCGTAQPLAEKELVRQAAGWDVTLLYKQELLVLMGRRPVGYRHPANISHCLLTGSAEKGHTRVFCLDRFPNLWRLQESCSVFAVGVRTIQQTQAGGL